MPLLSDFFSRTKAIAPPIKNNSISVGSCGEPKNAVDNLFPKVDPAVDGEECQRDCESCTIRLPKNFKIDEEDVLYGKVKPWATHVLVATGKADWTHDIKNEPGSIMEAFGMSDIEPRNGRMMLSASNIPVPENYDLHNEDTFSRPTKILLLPSFTFIENVTPDTVPDLVRHFIEPAPTTRTPLIPNHRRKESEGVLSPICAGMRSRPCPHKAVILMCSQKTRDARCGQSAPLLRREFRRHLQPLGLYRDLDDERPGGVGIYFISHVGGHKYSANVIIYRRGYLVQGSGSEPQSTSTERSEEAWQGIWLARVKPEDCEGIVKYTILQGKVVDPRRQLRGGFDRVNGLVSW